MHLAEFGKEGFFTGFISIDIPVIEVGSDILNWPIKVVPVANDTPYIIVDNQRISPIERSPRSDSAPAGHKGLEEETFGVVDRVTISTEARETYRWHAAHAGTVPPSPEDPSNKPPVATTPLLTY